MQSPCCPLLPPIPCRSKDGTNAQRYTGASMPGSRLGLWARLNITAPHVTPLHMYSQGAHHNPADGHVELSCLDIVAKSSTGGIIVPIRIILNSAIYEALACLNCRCPEFDLRAAAPENAACGDDGRRKHLQSQSRSAAPTGAQSRLFTRIEGDGTDAELMRSYLAAWGDKEAYAVAHVGFGMNPRARYEALTLYDQPRHQRHRAARGRRQLPVLHRSERIRRPLHRRPLRHSGDADDDHGRRHRSGARRGAAGRVRLDWIGARGPWMRRLPLLEPRTQAAALFQPASD